MGKSKSKNTSRAKRSPSVAKAPATAGAVPIDLPAVERLPTTHPGFWGGVLAMALGVGLVILGGGNLVQGGVLPMPLVVALLIAGGSLAAVSWFAIERRRPAWAFAVAISATAAIAFLLGSPKLRSALDIPLGVALIPCIVGATATLLLGMAGRDVR